MSRYIWIETSCISHNIMYPPDLGTLLWPVWVLLHICSRCLVSKRFKRTLVCLNKVSWIEFKFLILFYPWATLTFTLAANCQIFLSNWFFSNLHTCLHLKFPKGFDIKVECPINKLQVRWSKNWGYKGKIPEKWIKHIHPQSTITSDPGST